MEVSGHLHAPAASPPGKEPLAHMLGGWVGSRAGLDVVVKRKIPSPPPRKSNPRTPIVQPVAQRYTDLFFFFFFFLLLLLLLLLLLFLLLLLLYRITKLSSVLYM
jgi:hypothetical protein